MCLFGSSLVFPGFFPQLHGPMSVSREPYSKQAAFLPTLPGVYLPLGSARFRGPGPEPPQYLVAIIDITDRKCTLLQPRGSQRSLQESRSLECVHANCEAQPEL